MKLQPVKQFDPATAQVISNENPVQGVDSTETNAKNKISAQLLRAKINRQGDFSNKASEGSSRRLPASFSMPNVTTTEPFTETSSVANIATQNTQEVADISNFVPAKIITPRNEWQVKDLEVACSELNASIATEINELDDLLKKKQEQSNFDTAPDTALYIVNRFQLSSIERNIKYFLARLDAFKKDNLDGNASLLQVSYSELMDTVPLTLEKAKELFFDDLEKWAKLRIKESKQCKSVF